MTWMNDSWTITICLAIAVLRIYLEVVSFDFASLPVTARMMNPEQAKKFHKMGFYFSI